MHLLIADDHALFRDAISQYVERADPSSSVTVTSNLNEAIKVINDLSVNNKTLPDLTLLDLNMPGMNGLTGFDLFRKTFPDMPVGLMSGVAEPEDVQRSMDMGAVGYFPKTLSGRALLKAIELVLTGEKFIPVNSKTNGLMPSYFNEDSSGKSALSLPLRTTGGLPEQLIPNSKIRLTPRENDVLMCLCRGQSNKDIAKTLDLQDVTIKLHVRSICRKLDVTSRTQAVLKAFELGLVKR